MRRYLENHYQILEYSHLIYFIGYVARLHSMVITAITTGLQDDDGYDYPEPVLTPPNLSSNVEHPQKAELVQRHRSRFLSNDININDTY